MKRKAKILPPKFKMMARMKFDLDKGLGKYSQGRRNPIKAVRVLHKVGLGFKTLLKQQCKKNKKMRVNYKVALRFISTSRLPKHNNTLPTISPAQAKPTEHSTSQPAPKPIIVPPSVISPYHLEAAPHICMSNTKPSVPEVGECSSPTFQNIRKTTPLL